VAVVGLGGRVGATLQVSVGLAHAAAQDVLGGSVRRLRSAASTVAAGPGGLGARAAGVGRRVWRRGAHIVDQGPPGRAQAGLRHLVDRARTRGTTTVDSSRAEARALVHDGAQGGIAWAGRRLAPPVVDALVPHLVSSVVPRIVDGILPYLEQAVVPRLVEAAVPLVRSTVLPMVIEDLSADPSLRKLLFEQSRSVVGQAADELRGATAQADDRVEDFFHGLVHRRHREHEERAPASPAVANNRRNREHEERAPASPAVANNRRNREHEESDGANP
jgi:hypothetical protein